MVTIKEIKKSKCEASGKDAEGVVCEFKNGLFAGFLSWQEFKKLCRLMNKSQQEVK